MSDLVKPRAKEWSVREEAEELIHRFGPGALNIVESRVRSAHPKGDRARQRCLARIVNKRLGQSVAPRGLT